MTTRIATDAVTRRGFMGIAAVSAAALPAAGVLARQDAAEPGPVEDRFPSQDYDSVRSTVGASHGNIARVTELVEARPALAKAAVDWGFGDWESAIGAASHVGNREIAELLIRHGARPDIFTCAMMGWVDAVRGIVERSPGVQRLLGPHGFTLAHHARVGGDEAAPVRDYLATIEGADEQYDNTELESIETYIGTYAFGPGERDRFVVMETRFGLAIDRSSGFGRTLIRVDEHVFHPVGAEAVRIVFDVREGATRSMTVHDPGPLVTATRVPG